MATYKTDVKLNASAEQVYDKLSDMSNLKSMLENLPQDQIPEDKRDLFQQITITDNSITIPGGPVGSITLKQTEKVRPTLIKLAGENSPVPLSLEMKIYPETEISCTATVSISLDVPALLKPMISGPVQKMTDQFGAVLKAIPFV